MSFRPKHEEVPCATNGIVAYETLAASSAELLDLEADRLRVGADLQRKYQAQLAESQAQYEAAMLAQSGAMYSSPMMRSGLNSAAMPMYG
eukprot:1148016-Rhodomonas_salina.1